MRTKILNLPNGLKVHLIKTNSNSTYFNLDIDFGGFHTDYKIDGITKTLPSGTAHFLEHKIFANPEGDGFEEMSKLGFYCNAMTNHERTSYVFSGFKNIEKGMDAILKTLDNPFFTDENVESERKIIIEEFNQTQDDPQSKMLDIILDKVASNHPISNQVLGTIEDINKITKETLLQAYNDFYQNNNRIIYISGPIDFDYLENYFVKYVSDKPLNNKNIELTIQPHALNNHSLQTITTEYLDIYQARQCFSICFPPVNDLKIRVKQEIITFMFFNLITTSTSKLHQTLMEFDYISGPIGYDLYSENDFFNVIVTFESEHSQVIQDQFIETLFERYKDDIDQEKFEIMKRAMAGSQVFNISDYEANFEFYIKANKYNVTAKEYIDLILETKIEDLYNFAKLITKNNIAIFNFYPNLNDEYLE